MGIQSKLVEATIPASATNHRLWSETCPTIVKRRILEIREWFTGSGTLDLTREVDTMWRAERTLTDYFKEPQVVDIDWSAGVTVYLYGTDRSGASNPVKLIIIYEELPV